MCAIYENVTRTRTTTRTTTTTYKLLDCDARVEKRRILAPVIWKPTEAVMQGEEFVGTWYKDKHR